MIKLKNCKIKMFQILFLYFTYIFLRYRYSTQHKTIENILWLLPFDIMFFEIKIVYVSRKFSFRSKKFSTPQNFVAAQTHCYLAEEWERPKRTVNIFLAGYSRRSWFYDFMGSILWSCRLDSRCRFLRSFCFLCIGKEEKEFSQARVSLVDFTTVSSYKAIFVKVISILRLAFVLRNN